MSAKESTLGLPNQQGQSPAPPQQQQQQQAQEQPVATDLSAQVTGSTEGQVTPVPEPPVFSRKNVARKIIVSLSSKVYKGYKPWVFTLRLALSGEAQTRRDKWLGLSQVEVNRTVKNQIIDEVCDLLLEDPQGFEDLPTNITGGGAGAGQRFKRYYEDSADDADFRFWLERIARAVNDAYWDAVSPREF
jgi:hypothetical protein